MNGENHSRAFAEENSFCQDNIERGTKEYFADCFVRYGFYVFFASIIASVLTHFTVFPNAIKLCLSSTALDLMLLAITIEVKPNYKGWIDNYSAFLFLCIITSFMSMVIFMINNNVDYIMVGAYCALEAILVCFLYIRKKSS